MKTRLTDRVSPTVRFILAVIVVYLVFIGSLFLLSARAADLDIEPLGLREALAYLADMKEIDNYRVTDQGNAYVAFQYLPRDYVEILESSAFVANHRVGHQVKIHFVTSETLKTLPKGTVICTITARQGKIVESDC